jgi:membrane-associated phospholipid phosphatase
VNAEAPWPRSRPAVLAGAATLFLVLAVYFHFQPHPTRLDVVGDEWIRAGATTNVWGDDPNELVVDYTFMGFVDGALVLTAWRFGGPAWALLVGGAWAGQELVIRFTKSAVARPRPDGAYSTTGAYPSGHVANLALAVLLFLLVVLPLLRRRRVVDRIRGEAAYAVLLVATYALYRVFAGEHWITDVVGGAALAVAFAIAAEWASRRLPPPA